MEPLGGSSCRLTAGDAAEYQRPGLSAKSGIALRDWQRRPGHRATAEAAAARRVRLLCRLLSILERDRSGVELTAVLDAITTNHTSFFREVAHFNFLAAHVLPALLARPASRAIAGWSAACSTGEEAYSIAVTLLDHTPTAQHDRAFAFWRPICRSRRSAPRGAGSTPWIA